MCLEMLHNGTHPAIFPWERNARHALSMDLVSLFDYEMFTVLEETLSMWQFYDWPDQNRSKMI